MHTHPPVNTWSSANEEIKLCRGEDNKNCLSYEVSLPEDGLLGQAETCQRTNQQINNTVQKSWYCFFVYLKMCIWTQNLPATKHVLRLMLV